MKLGGSSEIVVNLRISNTGDQSHSTQITINTSNNTEYIGYLQPQNEPPEYVVVCQNVIDINNISRVQCELKNALYQQQRAIVSVRFLVSRSLLIMKGQTLDNFDQHINFKIMVQSTSPDKDMSDNVKTLTATVILHSSVELSGYVYLCYILTIKCIYFNAFIPKGNFIHILFIFIKSNFSSLSLYQGLFLR